MAGKRYLILVCCFVSAHCLAEQTDDADMGDDDDSIDLTFIPSTGYMAMFWAFCAAAALFTTLPIHMNNY